MYCAGWAAMDPLVLLGNRSADIATRPAPVHVRAATETAKSGVQGSEGPRKRSTAHEDSFGHDGAGYGSRVHPARPGGGGAQLGSGREPVGPARRSRGPA